MKTDGLHQFFLKQFTFLWTKMLKKIKFARFHAQTGWYKYPGWIEDFSRCHKSKWPKFKQRITAGQDENTKRVEGTAGGYGVEGTEWRVRSGGYGVEGTEWRVRSGGYGVEGTEWRVRSGGYGVEGTEWRVRSGGYGVEGTEWRVRSGGYGVEGTEWRVRNGGYGVEGTEWRVRSGGYGVEGMRERLGSRTSPLPENGHSDVIASILTARLLLAKPYVLHGSAEADWARCFPNPFSLAPCSPCPIHVLKLAPRHVRVPSKNVPSAQNRSKW